MEDISKIVELKIEEEDFELENLGLEVVSFVKTPAIEVGWKSFSKEEDKEMIDGIVELLRQVEDQENRLNMLENVFKDFDDEGIEYNREDILDRVMIDEFVERQADETKDEFIERCMSKLVGEEGKETDQAYAICVSTYEKYSFETYDDYPQQARENACVAVRYAEENGWGDCGTDVGKQRAHQLCNGENISEDTISRMAAFERHRQNSDRELGDGCGRLMWLSWGGDEGVEWASRKLESIRKETLTTDTTALRPYVKQTGKIKKKEVLAEVGERGAIRESEKAPKSSTPNPSPEGVGTARGKASSTRGAVVDKETEETLKKKADDFNERYKDKLGYGVNVGMLKSVYQRGLGAFAVSHSPAVSSAKQWALARVNAFLYIVKEGRPENKKYVNDNDLLPKEHPKRTELSKYEELEEIVVGDIVLTIEAQENILQLADERGEIIEPEDLYISTAKEQFSLLSDILKGLSVIDALTTNQAADSPGERFYRYSGPPAERAFCRAILRMNKVYSKKDIDDMEAAGINRAFGHEGEPYSIFEYQGGPYCKHKWNKLLVFRGTNNQKVIVDEGPADGNAGITMNNRPFGGHHPDYIRQHMMSMDEEKRIVLGPMLIPNKMIERKDDDGSKYYVYFSRETIKKVAEKMMREHKHNNTDINHDENISNKNVLLESWIVEDPTYDKSYNYGFKLPKGTWMASYKVGDDETWNMIKSGQLRGFSIAGYFIEGQKRREASISK
jgi:hypothetical protein